VHQEEQEVLGHKDLKGVQAQLVYRVYKVLVAVQVQQDFKDQ
jgi:hypothetical protein